MGSVEASSGQAGGGQL